MATENNGKLVDSGEEYTLKPERIYTSLDPELQKILVDLRSGQPLDQRLREELASGPIVVDVVTKLQDPNRNVPGLITVQKIGQIVTGLVEAGQIEKVRRDPNVISMKAARRLQRMLSNSVPEVRASREQILSKLADNFDRQNFGPVDGSGVIVGIVDRGCDFAHPHFRKPDGLTRILYLWDQRGGLTKESPKNYYYGREFTADNINNALRARPATPANPRAPHDFLGYQIGPSAHGTRVMDIAAGNGTEINPPGVAPGADIIFVEASIGSELETDESFGNSRHLLEAVKYIFDKAHELKKGAVVNISLNFDSGPHDGSTPVEEGFDLLLEDPGRAIVIAAGNSRNRRIHTRKTIHPRQTSTIPWAIPNSDKTTNKMELWYLGQRPLELTLISPRGHNLGPFPLDSAFTIFRKGESAAQVFHRRKDSANNDNHIVLVFFPLMEEGVWQLVLRPKDRELFAPFDAHAWIETDQGDGSTFPESDDSYTVGAISCGHSVIAVSSYNVLDPTQLDSRSSEGPTRDGRQKPEVSAPGVRVRAASSLTASVADDGGGTSNAAPHVTGLIALLMQDAVRPPTIEEIRSVVVGSVRHNPPPETSVWNPRYGIGRIDAAEAIIRQRGLVRLPVTPPDHDQVVIDKELLIVEHEGVDKSSTLPEGIGSALSLDVAARTTFVASTLEFSTDSAGFEAFVNEVAEDRLTTNGVPVPPPTKGH